MLLALVMLAALPGTASAATVRVEPYREPPDPAGGCARIMACPADMLVFAAGPGEPNNVRISGEPLIGTGATPDRTRFLVVDQVPLQPGPGCERVPLGVACVAHVVGPIELGDLQDRIAAPIGLNAVSGGAGDDVLDIFFGNGDVNGGAGDDIVIARNGNGDAGADVLSVNAGTGGTGDDLLICLSQTDTCSLLGGTGNDRLIGGKAFNAPDRLVGGPGSDFLAGRGGPDTLLGERGNDRLRGGGGADTLRGGSGVDLLEARELRSRGERTARDDVNCGAGRRDRAVADRRDRVTRCERVRRRGS